MLISTRERLRSQCQDEVTRRTVFMTVNGFTANTKTMIMLSLETAILQKKKKRESLILNLTHWILQGVRQFRSRVRQENSMFI